MWRLTLVSTRPEKIGSVVAARRHGVAMLLASLVLVLPSLASAGPWTKEPGQVYVKASEMLFRSDTFVAANGERVSGTDYLALTSAVYLEAGLTKKLHFQAFMPWSFTRNEFTEIDTRYANVGLGDTILGLQITPYKLNLPYALRLETKIPLYDVAGIEGPEANMFPALGDGQVDVTGWLSVGGSLYPKPIYFLGEIGYRHRTEIFYGEGSGLEFGNGLTFNAQVGYTFKERVLVAGNAGGVYSFVDDAFTQSFVTLGPTVAVFLPKGFALEAGASPMVWSRNNSPGTTYSIGVSYSQ